MVYTCIALPASPCKICVHRGMLGTIEEISLICRGISSGNQICRMVELLIDNIFVKIGGCPFRQVIGIPMGTNCAPLLADLFLYSYESEFLDNMIRGGHRKLARSFNLC